jgi:hypothetical protein
MSRSASAALLLTFVVACGYHAAYADPSGGRLHVKLLRSLVPDAVASDEVAAGVRDELARCGWLEAGERYPRVEIEVLRADEASEAIGARGTPAVPLARSLDVGIAARAWIVEAPGGAPERDTGDMRAEDVVAVDLATGVGDPTADALHHPDALRSAARRLGRTLAQRLLGAPGPSEDGVSAPARPVVRSGSAQ